MSIKLIQEWDDSVWVSYYLLDPNVKSSKTFHREDGPAMFWSNVNFTYYNHGKIHREDGPADVCGPTITWYWQDVRLGNNTGLGLVNSPKDFESWKKLKAFI